MSPATLFFAPILLPAVVFIVFGLVRSIVAEASAPMIGARCAR